MAYNDDAVLARLSSLNESHDSIATAAQWVMFHRRHADRTVQLWMQRVKDSSSTKRLTLMYLANEVAQQSRIRHKEDFIIAFSPVIAEATALAYKGAPAELQGKLKRVVDVWKDRSIFEVPIQSAIESRIGDLDKARGTAKTGFAGTPFSSSAAVPPEFTPLISAYQKAAKASVPSESAISNAAQEYQKHLDPSTAPPSAPVYAARLNGLLKVLANAENAVSECVKARETLVLGLEKLLDANRAALEADRTSATTLGQQKDEVEAKKQEVELAIMRALGPAHSEQESGEGGSASPAPEPDRPEMEALTPEMEAFTPPSVLDEPLAMLEETPAKETTAYQTLPISTNGSNKRRRVDDSEDFPNLGGEDGIDEDVAAMLKDGD